MELDNIVIVPQKKHRVLPGLIFLGLWLGWLFGGCFVACNEYRVIKEAQRAQQEKHRVQVERQRRQAAYEQRLLEEKATRSGVQNAMDGIKR